MTTSTTRVLSWRRLVRALAIAGGGIAVIAVAWVALYRVVPPPATPLMLIRSANGAGMTATWRPIDRLPSSLVRAVIASEDDRFCGHAGFDWRAIEEAMADTDAGRSLRGGSTISQQTAKNAFLWPDRTWARKGMEAVFTVLIEALWSKRRILEVYLNIVEWGDGLYGAEAAARTYFGKAAAALTPREAALLAVVLPNPRHWSPAHPGPWVERRAAIIEQRMAVVARDGLDGCVRP